MPSIDLIYQVTHGPHERFGAIFHLQPKSPEQARALASALAELAADPSSELRHRVAPELTIFWKLKEGGTKLLLAHPEQNEWVATISMTTSYAQALILRLEEKGAAILSEIDVIHPVSNLELVLARAAGAG